VKPSSGTDRAHRFVSMDRTALLGLQFRAT